MISHGRSSRSQMIIRGCLFSSWLSCNLLLFSLWDSSKFKISLCFLIALKKILSNAELPLILHRFRYSYNSSTISNVPWSRAVSKTSWKMSSFWLSILWLLRILCMTPIICLILNFFSCSSKYSKAKSYYMGAYIGSTSSATQWACWSPASVNQILFLHHGYWATSKSCLNIVFPWF